MWVRLLLLLAVFASAQVVAGDRGVIFLGSVWESPPRADGVGVLDLMFFLEGAAYRCLRGGEAAVWFCGCRLWV